jgi:hypothetical protein
VEGGGTVLATRRFDEAMSAMDDRGFAASVAQDATGIVRWTVWSFKLVR